MGAQPHRVALVVDPDFGERLTDLAKRVHVWACESRQNAKVARQLWRENPEHSLESGVTTFQVKASDSPQDMCIGILGAIEDHHGGWSHDPPWSILEVYGADLTDGVKRALNGLGFECLEEGKGFFTASRRRAGPQEN